jgi:hypothetical protein
MGVPSAALSSLCFGLFFFLAFSAMTFFVAAMTSAISSWRVLTTHLKQHTRQG